MGVSLHLSGASPDIATPFVRCFEKVKYEKAYGQPIAVTRELAMSTILPETELIQLSRPFVSAYLLLNWTYKGPNGTLSIKCVLGGVMYSLFGAISRYWQYVTL